MLIQRLGAKLQTDDAYIDGILSAVAAAPGSCDEVWFATLYGYPTPEEHQKTARTLSRMAKKVRDAGIGVSLQVSNTVGHGEYMASLSFDGLHYPGSPVRHLVGPDGTVAGYCFCWRDLTFRKYLEETLKTYASAVQPDTVWFDDDFRATNHAPVGYGCFCDDCVRAYNTRFGTSYDRPSLVAALNDTDATARENYIAFIRDAFYDLALALSRVVHEAAPDARMGYEYYCNGSYTGYGYDFIFRAMREGTGKNPVTRPGGGAYNDNDPNAFLLKAEEINWQNAMLPPYVTRTMPEIENLPDVVYGKSIAGTCLETSYYFANGNTDMTYAMMTNQNEPMSWHAEMLQAFSRHRPYWDKLAALAVGTRQSGISVAISKENYRTLSTQNTTFPWSYEPWNVAWRLRKTAIPFTFTPHADGVYFLHADNAERLTDAEIRELMTHPVLTDGYAMAVLARRGYTLGVRTEIFYNRRFQVQLTDAPINGDSAGKKWSYSLFTTEGACFTELPAGTEVLARYVAEVSDVDKTKLGAAATIVLPLETGARWLVYGYDFTAPITPFFRRNQMLRALDAISGNRFRATLLSPLQASVLPREDADGNLTSVSVLNMTVGESGKLLLRIRKPKKERFAFMSQTSPEIPLTFTRDGEDYLVEMPSLPAWSVGTVFCGSV